LHPNTNRKTIDTKLKFCNGHPCTRKQIGKSKAVFSNIGVSARRFFSLFFSAQRIGQENILEPVLGRPSKKEAHSKKKEKKKEAQTTLMPKIW
jgi:hypothetical protein